MDKRKTKNPFLCWRAGKKRKRSSKETDGDLPTTKKVKSNQKPSENHSSQAASIHSAEEVSNIASTSQNLNQELITFERVSGLQEDSSQEQYEMADRIIEQCMDVDDDILREEARASSDWHELNLNNQDGGDETDSEADEDRSESGAEETSSDDDDLAFGEMSDSEVDCTNDEELLDDSTDQADFSSQNYIVDLHFLIEQLQKYKCPIKKCKGSFESCQISSVLQTGLEGTLYLECNLCHQRDLVRVKKTPILLIRPNNKPCLNESAVLGTIATGGGAFQMQMFTASLGIQPMTGKFIKYNFYFFD